MVSAKLEDGGSDGRLEQPNFCSNKVKSKGFRQLPLAGRSVFNVGLIKTGVLVDLRGGAGHGTHH
eukprot:5127841-Ditylum_brightwellii.AAC.1